MATVCTSEPTGSFATQLLADTDCQAFGLVERGYAALAQPGGTVSLALTGLLTIAVAIYGYRLLLGRGLAVSDAVRLTVRIGIVLLLATSWESWQALVYRGLAQAPTEIASSVLEAIGEPAPLRSLDRSLESLTQAAVGYRSRAGIASPLVGGPAAAAAVLNISSVVLTVSIIGILVAARVVQAVLLALAPAMAGLLLFRATRGMAQGWLGAIAAAALAPLFVLLIAAIELAILGPMIARLLARQVTGTFDNASVMPIGLVCVVFAIAMGLALRTVARIGYGLRLVDRVDVASQRTTVTEPAVTTNTSREVAVANSRLVQTLETLSRRDEAAGTVRVAGGTFSSTRASASARDGRGADRLVTAGPSELPSLSRTSNTAVMRRAPRRSRAATRRDG